MYRAPEQEAFNSKASKRNTSYNVQADIYSLGIILFEMFHPPFDTVRNAFSSLEVFLFRIPPTIQKLDFIVHGTIANFIRCKRRFSKLCEQFGRQSPKY
jgi:serine/threonine protein kinase